MKFEEIEAKAKCCCENCEFNFGTVCAGYGKRLDNGEDTYGMPMEEAKKMFPDGCDNYGISMMAYMDIRGVPKASTKHVRGIEITRINDLDNSSEEDKCQMCEKTLEEDNRLVKIEFDDKNIILCERHLQELEVRIKQLREFEKNKEMIIDWGSYV